jgi:O-antigen ligase
MKNHLVINEVKTYQIGFIILILFCALRPIFLLDLRIVGINFIELFAISISYLLLVSVAANIKNWKLDFISLTMLYFCFYCGFSILWGSKIRTVTQIILPFAVFFSIRLFIKNPDQIRFLLSVVIIAYLIPIFGSFYQILQGTTISHVESLTGIERHAGLFQSIRPMASAMFFFSVFFCLKFIMFRPGNRYFRYFLVFMLLISFFCVFKSYTRSILLGLFIFWGIVLIGFNKKYFLIFLFLTLISGLLYPSTLQQIFFKTEEFEINTASSGRAFLWEHNIRLFKTYSLDEKFLGRGLGVVTKGVIGKENEIWSSHNDYLHLLMQGGGVGLFLYLLIHMAILKEVFFSHIEKKLKYFYLGFIFSIIFMNFASGIITYQLPTAQFFWMVMGFYYIFAINHKTTTIKDTQFNTHSSQALPAVP